MATLYDYAYYIDGKYIAILQKTVSSIYNPYLRINENLYLTPENSDSSGIMIEYSVTSTAPTDDQSTLDVDAQTALALVDYVKYRLYEERENEQMAQRFYNKFLSRISRANRDKQGKESFIVGTLHPGMIL